LKHRFTSFDQRYLRYVSWSALFFNTLIHSAFAESTNKRTLLPGGRAQSIGGAFSAIADDASASWYNPAGLGFLHGPGVNVTVNSYSKLHKEISGIDGESKLSENSSTLYPGFAGGNANFGAISFGWSYFTLEQQNTDEAQNFDIPSSTTASAFNYSRTEVTTGNLIHAGASMALAIGNHVAIGVSEFYYRRQKHMALKERSYFKTNTFYDSFIRQSTLNEGTVSVGGLMVRDGNFSLGITAQIPKTLTDRTDFDTSTVTYSSGTPDLNSTTSISHREDEIIVNTYSAGVAWTPSHWFTASSDVLYYPSSKSKWSSDGGIQTKSTYNGSAGLQLSSESFLVNGGVFSNNSLVTTPTPSLVTPDPMQINFLGLSSGLGYRTKLSETLFIMVRQRGTGKAQLVQGDLSLQNIYIETQSYSISTRYQF
jgi:hypothetical protein